MRYWQILLPNHSDGCLFLERLIANISHGKGALYPHVEDHARSFFSFTFLAIQNGK
ncbi:5'-nucleosidase [Bacillus haynesii]|nr:5'-nucleosidase [Bacillus haynesii]